MTWKNFFAPALKVAGGRALVWGVAGLAVCVVCAIFSGWHAHGLLHFGPAPRDAAWISALEYLTIWLIPAAIFYGLGAVLSRSRVRAIDVFGTTAFALLPLTVMNLAQLLPGTKEVFAVVREPVLDLGLLIETMAKPLFIVHMVIMTVVMVVMVVWLFNAVKVSCNLRGWRLWTVYLVGLIVGDIVCRQVMTLLYS